MSSALSFYSGTPFVVSNQVSLDDTFVGDGVTTTFTLVNKTVSQLAASIQAGNIVYYFYNGGFTTNTGANTFTLSSAPPIGTQIVAPGVNQETLSAFDQPVVPGVVNPLTTQAPCWIMDVTTINNYKYLPLPGYVGLQMSAVQLISGTNAQTSWIQFASADASGNALTYGASGAPLYLPSLDAFTTLASSVTTPASSFYVIAASGGGTQFWPGQYVRLNIGNATQEIVHVIAVDYVNNIFTIDPTGVTYSHSPGETVYACGWKFWMQLTIPENANNNVGVNLYNIGLQRASSIRARP